MPQTVEPGSEQVVTIASPPALRSSPWQRGSGGLGTKNSPGPASGKENAVRAPAFTHQQLSPAHFAVLQHQQQQHQWWPQQAGADGGQREALFQPGAPTPAPMTGLPGGGFVYAQGVHQQARTPSPVSGVVQSQQQGNFGSQASATPNSAQPTPSSTNPFQHQQPAPQQRPDSASRRLEALQQRHAELLRQVDAAEGAKQQAELAQKRAEGAACVAKAQAHEVDQQLAAKEIHLQRQVRGKSDMLGEQEAAKQASLTALASALAEKQGQLEATVQQLQEATARLEGADAEVAATDSRLRDKAERLRTKLQEEVQAARKQVEEAQQRARELLEQRREREAQLAQTTQQVDEAQCTLKQVGADLVANEARLAITTSQVESTQTKLAAKQAALADTEACLRARQTALAEAEGRWEAVQQQAGCVGGLAGAAQRLVEVQQQLAGLEAQVQSRQRELAEASSACETALQKLTSVSSELASAQLQLEMRQNGVADAEAACAAACQRQKGLEQAAEAAERGLDETQRKAEEWQQALGRAQRELEGTHNEWKDVSQRMTLQQGQLEKLEGLTQQAENELQALSSKISQLSEQRIDAEKQAQNAAQTLEGRQQEMAATEQAIIAARQCLENLQREGHSVAAAKQRHAKITEEAAQSEAMTDRVQVLEQELQAALLTNIQLRKELAGLEGSLELFGDHAAESGAIAAQRIQWLEIELSTCQQRLKLSNEACQQAEACLDLARQEAARLSAEPPPNLELRLAEAELADLQFRISQAEAATSAEAERAEQAEKAAKQAQQALEARGVEAARLARQLEAVTARLQEVEAKRGTTVDELASLRTECSHQQRVTGELRAQIAQLSGMVQQLRRERASAQGLAESLQLQVESLHDRLHTAHLRRLALPGHLLEAVHCSQEQCAACPGDRQLRRLQSQVAELSVQNSALKAAAARLSKAFEESMTSSLHCSDERGARGSSAAAVNRGSCSMEAAAAVLSELTAAERILDDL
ncbi:hypothetical protein N2152v2_008035 [Parachlorella kessleri]